MARMYLKPNIHSATLHATFCPVEVSWKLHHVTIDHVMPREKREKKDAQALDSCFGLVGPHQQCIPQLLSLASRMYVGQKSRATCCMEVERLSIRRNLCRAIATYTTQLYLVQHVV